MPKQNKSKMRPGKISHDEAERMFNFWLANEKQWTLTAREFKRSPSTIHRIAARHNWRRKVEGIENAKQKALEQAAAKQQVSDLKIVDAAISRAVRDILGDGSNVVAKYSDLVALIRLKLEMTGLMPQPERGDNIVNVVTETGGYGAIERLLGIIERSVTRPNSRL